MKKLAILGSTGSIGTQTLDLVEHHPDLFSVDVLAAGGNVDLLIQQARKFRPRTVCLATAELAERAREALPPETTVLYGPEGLVQAAADNEANTVVTALVGSRGLEATLAAIDAGKQIALANKETLVTAGHLVMERARSKGVAILPVDSEHSAIFQCLNGESMTEVKRITLTASGGSFRHLTRSELEGVTVEQALNHPNWSMGAKITIDSATMANKGLEVIEARWLFDLPYDQINVLIHPESIIHSYVEFVDQSIIAQLGLPDMRVPIQYALTYPNRISNPTAALNLAELGKLTFREMDFERYPCLQFAYESGKLGQSAPTVFNAANEVAVARFLAGEITFLEIERVIETVLGKHEVSELPTVESILHTDEWARRMAQLV